MKKKKQWKRYAPTFLFCIFIAVMMVLFFALPKQSFSSNEKRVLEETHPLLWAPWRTEVTARAWKITFPTISPDAIFL